MVLTVQPWHLDQEAIGRILELVQSSESCQQIDWSYFDVNIRGKVKRLHGRRSKHLLVTRKSHCYCILELKWQQALAGDDGVVVAQERLQTRWTLMSKDQKDANY